MGVRILVVGQAPARGSRRGVALGQETASGRRLRELLGGAEFEAVNLRGDFPGKNPGSRCPSTGRLRNCGDRFPGPSRRGARRVGEAVLRSDVVLLLGTQVARHLRSLFPRRPVFFEEHEGVVSWQRLYMVPHPSGTSRWWNDAANAEAARRFFADLTEGIK